MSEALVTLSINPSLALAMKNAENKVWTGGAQPRTTVADVIQVTENAVIINPNSDPHYGAETNGALDRQAVYAAFAIATGALSQVTQTVHMYAHDPKKARYAEPQLFQLVEGKWVPKRWQNEGWVEVTFENENERAFRGFQQKHDWISMVIKGARVEVDLSSAKPLLDYFASLLTKSVEEAKATIAEHERRGTARRITYRASKDDDVVLVDSVTVNGAEYELAALENERLVAVNEDEGIEFNVRGNQKAWISTLVQSGYTFEFATANTSA